jgi:Fur family peroxide stress response transcriptional regulator
MAGKTRKSVQRERILEALRQTRSHPTAKWLFNKVRKQFPSLSLGTVYRNLGLLVVRGLASRLDFGNGVDRFEATSRPHHHFVCEGCGQVADLDLPIDPSLTRKLRKATGYAATRHEIRLYGLCKECSLHRSGQVARPP